MLKLLILVIFSTTVISGVLGQKKKKPFLLFDNEGKFGEFKLVLKLNGYRPLSIPKHPALLLDLAVKFF